MLHLKSCLCKNECIFEIAENCGSAENLFVFLLIYLGFHIAHVKKDRKKGPYQHQGSGHTSIRGRSSIRGTPSTESRTISPFSRNSSDLPVANFFYTPSFFQIIQWNFSLNSSFTFLEEGEREQNWRSQLLAGRTPRSVY